jgi:hypothetical protein
VSWRRRGAGRPAGRSPRLRGTVTVRWILGSSSRRGAAGLAVGRASSTLSGSHAGWSSGRPPQGDPVQPTSAFGARSAFRYAETAGEPGNKIAEAETPFPLGPASADTGMVCSSRWQPATREGGFELSGLGAAEPSNVGVSRQISYGSIVDGDEHLRTPVNENGVAPDGVAGAVLCGRRAAGQRHRDPAVVRGHRSRLY